MKIKCVCKHCGKEFFTWPCHIRNGGGKYCSTKCATAVNNRDTNIIKKRARSRPRRAGENSASYTHGQSKTRLYAVWNSMRQRCENEKSSCYERYGGRGIRVCKEWTDSFEAFRDWSLSNGYAAGLTIDRIDNSGDYRPGNCRWTTPKEQSRNRRTTHYVTYRGVTKSLPDWCDDLSLEYNKIRRRLSDGWSVDRAFTTL